MQLFHAESRTAVAPSSMDERKCWIYLRMITSTVVGLPLLAALLLGSGVLSLVTHAPAIAHAQTVPAAQATSSQTVQGAGLFGVNDGGVDWVNVMNGVNRVNVPSTGNAAPVDAQGWPTTDAQYILFDARKNMPWDGPDPTGVNQDISGACALSFTGQATLSADSQTPNALVVSNQSYDSGTNTTTATVTVQPNQWLVLLDFTNTRRQPGDTPGDGITNIRLIRPGYAANTTQIFTNDTIKAYSLGFSTIRVGEAGIGSNFCGTTLTTTQWADRVLVSQAFQGQTPTVQNGQICSDPNTPTGHQGYGLAWEYDVALANQTNENLWLMIPYNATDDYITKLAELLKYGSDGVNPYTSPQSNPVWAPLNPNLKVYVEDSDEVWNFSYPEYTWNKATAANEVNAGGSPLNNDGDTSQDDWAARNYGQRIYQMSNLFKNVYGASGFDTTYRPVLDWQYDTEYASGVFGPGTDTVMEWLNKTYGPPDQYLYGIGEAPYYDANDVSSVDNIFNSLYVSSDASRSRLIDWQTLASYYGLKQVGYEAGPSLGADLGALATRDPRMTASIVHHFLDNWYAIGGDQVNFESMRGGIGSYGDWLLVEEYDKLNTPKMQGALDVLNSQLPAITSGYVLPTASGQSTSIDASQYAESSQAPGSTLSIGGDSSAYPHPYSYLLRAAYDGTYTFSLTGVQDSNDLQATLSVDNSTLGNLQLPTTAGTTSTLSVPLSAGFHTLSIVYTYVGGSGSDHAHPQSINLGLSSGGGALVVPSAPGNPSIQTVADGSLTIQWPTTTLADTYTLARSTSVTGPFTPIASNLTQNSYTDTGLTDGTPYYYVVTANNGAGSSANSPLIPGVPTHSGVPAAPTNLQATFAQNGVVQLTWTGNSDAYGYRIWRSTTSGSGYQVISTASSEGAAPLNSLSGEQAATNFKDGGQGPFVGGQPTDGTTYYYVVTAVNGFGESGYSTELTVTPTDAKPGVPTNLTATAGDGTITLTWTPPPGMSPQFSPPQYNVYRSTTSGGPYTQVIQTSVANATDVGLQDGTTYYYVVTANNAQGEGTASSEVSAQPAGGLNGTYQLTNQQSNLVLDNTYGGGAGTHEQQWPANGTANQHWIFTSAGNGYYTIQCANNGLYLDVDGGTTNQGANVVIEPQSGADSQLWQLVPTGSGSYDVVNKHSGYVLDDEYASDSAGNPIIQWPNNGNPNQHWSLQSVS